MGDAFSTPTGAISLFVGRHLRVDQRQLIGGSLLRIADVKPVTDDDRMVPGLSFQRLEGSDLDVLVWVRGQKHDLTWFSSHQEQTGILQ